MHTNTKSARDRLATHYAMVLRRGSTADGRGTELQIKKVKGLHEPHAKDAWEEKGWIPMPKLHKMGRLPFYKEHFPNQLIEQWQAYQSVYDGKDLTPAALDYAHFLHSAGLTPNERLLPPGQMLPEAALSWLRPAAIACHQAAIAVGTYFDDAALARHLPKLGVLMGDPTLEQVRDTFRYAFLTPMVAALALKDTLPLDRALRVGLHIEECSNSSGEYVADDNKITSEERTQSASELYVKIIDDETQEVLRTLPLAYATQYYDSAAAQDEVNLVRTSLPELKEGNFIRYNVGQFEPVVAPAPQG